MAQTFSDAGIEALREAMGGPIYVAGDRGYDEARAVWNAGIDRRPGVIACCESTADAVAAVGFARERSLDVAVRGGPTTRRAPLCAMTAS